MEIRLYNTLTRQKDPFEPANPPKVGLYTCGPTVYDYAHIGNLRMYIFEDILKRALSKAGYEVTHVMNVTDVGHLVSDADEGEDKMALGARREGKSVWEIAEFYWKAFRRDLERLNILEPDIWCKATDHIAEQIDLVGTLQDKGFTYVIDDGVYFDTSKFPQYGRLARLDVGGLLPGARIEMVSGKRNTTDFALWKLSPKDSQRLMEWKSPWGVGFPAWHLECSAMAIKYLGERLDIHCGGVDHIAVHHTNEIAQAECALGHKWANWWMHGEFLTLPANEAGQESKMSKSSGGFLTLEELVERGTDPLAYRYFLLNAHYRQQLAFTWAALDGAANAFARLKRAVLALRDKYSGCERPLESHLREFHAAVADDLNMPRALAAMWGAVKDTDTAGGEIYATLLEMDTVLGLGFDKKEDVEAGTVETVDRLFKQVAGRDAGEGQGRQATFEEKLERVIAARRAARKANDFARADEIRAELVRAGITLEDTPTGTDWRPASTPRTRGGA